MIDYMDMELVALRPIFPPPTKTNPPLLPANKYATMCASAHQRAGLLDHFLDSTLLNDRKTTMREYWSPMGRESLAIAQKGEVVTMK